MSSLQLRSKFTSHRPQVVQDAGAPCGAGKVTVDLIPTDQNPADLFTKVPDKVPFERHRKFVMNGGVNFDKV